MHEDNGQRAKARTETSTARAARLRFPPLRARVYVSPSLRLPPPPTPLPPPPPPSSLPPSTDGFFFTFSSPPSTSRSPTCSSCSRRVHVVVTAVYMHAPVLLPAFRRLPPFPPLAPRTKRRTSEGSRQPRGERPSPRGAAHAVKRRWRTTSDEQNVRQRGEGGAPTLRKTAARSRERRRAGGRGMPHGAREESGIRGVRTVHEEIAARRRLKRRRRQRAIDSNAR